MIENLKHGLTFLLFLAVLFIYPFSIFYGYNIFFGVFVLFYFAIQTLYAALNYRHCRRLTLPSVPPSVVLLVVGYRENPGYWEECLRSILRSTYPNIRAVVAFVDGDQPEDTYMSDIFNRVMRDEDARFSVFVRLCPHQGKRHMLEQGYRHIRSHFPLNDYVIVIDSDTIIEPDGVEELVKCIHANPNNACATGNIQIFNRNTLLARVIHSRYLYAFTIERSAQAYAGVMTCCSGPFSIYRQAFLTDDFLDDFIGDTFCGKPVAAGDDRVQTNLLLGRGYYARQTPFAVATTETPDKLGRYIMQQCRWSRSTIRCLKYQVRAIGKQHPYLAVCTIYETLFPFLVVVGFLPTFDIVHQASHHTFLQRLGVAAGVLLIRTLLLACFNKMDFWQCAPNVLIFPLYFTILLPVKIYAWCTPWIQSWMTSSRKFVFSTINTDTILIYSSIAAWNTLVALCAYSKFSGLSWFYPPIHTQ